MAKGKQYDAEKRAAVMGALLAGQAVAEVARNFQLDISTVWRWQQKIPANKLQELATKSEADFDQLLRSSITEALTSFKTICQETRRPDYIAKQPASEIAVLAGVITDKALRILSAYEPEQEPAVTGEVAQAQEVPSVH